MKKTILIAGSILLVIVGLFAYYSYRQVQKARSARSNIQYATVERGPLVAQIGASGTVRSNQSAVLTWQTSGTVDGVVVEIGQVVSKGEELASLAQSSLSQAMILAQADLVNAQKALDDLQTSQVAEAQARQSLQKAQQALDDLEKDTLMQQAQAQDALLKAQKALSDTIQTRDNLNQLANSDKAQDARQELENAEGLVNHLYKAYNSLPGTPETNPEKAKVYFDLKIARLRRDQAQRKADLYGGDPSSSELKRAEADVLLAEAKLADAQVAWERIKDGADAVNRAMLEAQLSDAQHTYDRVKNGPNADDLKAAQARVAAAQASLDMAHVAAPFAGTITLVNNKPGDQVSPGGRAFRLDDLSRLLVDVDVSEVDINQVRAGQPVVLTFDSILGKEYHGNVVEVASVGTLETGVVNFTVTVELSDADEQVKPGMTAAASIVVSELKDVLLIPNRAVRSVDGKPVVYVLRSGILTPVEITIGKTSDIQSEVTGGDLRAGDQIVINPSSLPVNLMEMRNGGGGGGGPFGGMRP